MFKNGIVFLIVVMFLSCNLRENNQSIKDFAKDETLINQSVKDWEIANATKDLGLAIKHYSNQINWTNTFGVKVHSKEELREFLLILFSMDYVLVGESNYEENEITFLSDSVATVWSKNTRTNQKWTNGSKRGDSQINHLRIYRKNDGIWQITDHLISQAWPKGSK